MYSGYAIALDEADSWHFGNDFAKNAVIFDVDNTRCFFSYKKIFIRKWASKIPKL